MAYSQSPTSPTLRARSTNHTNRRSTSPQAPPMSKKDKKRQTHNAHVQELHAEMAQNRDIHFKTQIVALTNEANLIQTADAYDLEPINDSAEDVRRKLEALAANTPYQSEVPAHAGRCYSDFARKVDQAKEEREMGITLIKNNYDSRLVQLKKEADYKLKVMDEEYKLMYKTLRERHINSLNSKINTLIREKEQLDLADTNSLLLNPTQFSITNPASPGGPHTNRKTRLTRQRMDGDDISATTNNLLPDSYLKRKRKALDEDPGSPGQDGTSTPADRAKARLLAHQPPTLHTVSSLFTDKELHAHSFNAHLAATHFFNNAKRNGVNGRLNHFSSHRGSSRSTASSNSDDDGRSSSSSTSSSQEKDKDHTEKENPLSAPEMDRTASTQTTATATTFHLTRSTRTNVGNFLGHHPHHHHGLNLLADLPDHPHHHPHHRTSSSTLNNSSSKPPTLAYAVMNNYNSKNGQTVPPITGLMPEETDEDLAKIEGMAAAAAATAEGLPRGAVGDEKLLDELCGMDQSRGKGLLVPDWGGYLDFQGQGQGQGQGQEKNGGGGEMAIAAGGSGGEG